MKEKPITQADVRIIIRDLDIAIATIIGARDFLDELSFDQIGGDEQHKDWLDLYSAGETVSHLAERIDSVYQSQFEAPMTDFNEGDRVVLRVVNDELRADGLHLGQTGIVRDLEGKLGVEFDGYSDTGWNAGLHAIKFSTRGDDGKIRPILALCEVIPPGPDPNKGIVARPGATF